MPAEMTIELKDIHFFAYHGLYAEEQKTGNEFKVTLSVVYTPSSNVITSLHSIVNYSHLYRLLKTEMQKPRGLLETFVMELAEVIYSSFPFIKKVEVSITKLQPPIAGFTGNVGVRFIKEY